MINMPGNEIHLWVVDEERPGFEDHEQAFLALLSHEECERYRRFIFAGHKRRFLLTRALVRGVLASYLNTRPADVHFTRDAYGKPRIQSGTLEFNLSHTNGLSVLAVTGGRPIGVDVESERRPVNILALAERYFSPWEVRALKALPTTDRNGHFFDLWTLKEAYVKACGLGLRIPLRDFGFQLHGEDVAITFAPARADDADAWRFWQYRLKDHFRLALAVKGGGDEVAGDYRLVWRQGWPLAEFRDFDPRLLRSSRRGVCESAGSSRRH